MARCESANVREIDFEHFGIGRAKRASFGIAIIAAE
jgi:hypothetical protein